MSLSLVEAEALFGRTKVHGYRPPAYWDRIADIRQCVKLPMVANGEIWTVADARRCIEVSGCTDLMLGRGIVADPGLALAIPVDQGLRDTLAWYRAEGLV